MKEIFCDECKKPITKKDDLIVTYKYFGLALGKFHKTCYVDHLKFKGTSSYFIGRKPINSIQQRVRSGVTFVLLILLGLLMLAITTHWSMAIIAVLIMIVALIYALIRIYAYIKYERGLGD